MSIRSTLIQIASLTGLYRTPDRRLLEHVILPSYAARNRNGAVLFAGQSFQSRNYHSLFYGRRFVAIEGGSSGSLFGENREAIDRIKNLDQFCGPNYFSLIVLNKMIGYGLDTVEDVNCALKACYRCLAPGGELVIDLRQDAENLPPVSAFDALTQFRPADCSPLCSSNHMATTRMTDSASAFLFLKKHLEELQCAG